MARCRDMGYGVEKKDLKSVVIPEDLRLTYKGSKFYWDDSGANDSKRIIIFTTRSNLDMLDKYRDWYCDGTFDITPTLFKQLYTIHIIAENKDLPMVYALMPNKDTNTYIKFFKMIRVATSKNPKSINIDFESAVFRSNKKVFGKEVETYGCFFHLSQNYFKRVQKTCLVNFYTDKNTRHAYKLLQAIAFVPLVDVEFAFEKVKSFMSDSFKDLIRYVEKYYIGILKPNSSSCRSTPRFKKETWNVHERVLKNLPRTNNSVESWHSQLSDHDKKDMKLVKLIELLRVEQAKTENALAKIKAGYEFKRSKEQVKKDNRLFKLCTEYNKENLMSFLEGVALNFE